MKQIFYLSFLSACIVLWADDARGQASESELLGMAHNLYVANQFSEAAPLYGQLISLQPSNPSYHYFYGVCLMNSSTDRKEAIRHLETAANSSKTPVLVNYYLGRAYFAEHLFEKASGSFQLFAEKSNVFYAKELKVEQWKEMCFHAAQFDFEESDKLVMDVIHTGETGFAGYYESGNSKARLLPIPSKYFGGRSKDKFSRYLHVDASGKWFVYSGPSKNNTSDIFIAYRKSSSSWSEPRAIVFEQPFDFEKVNPTLADNGKTIYFSSVSPESIGGFDVYKTTLIEKRGTWSAPQLLPPPVNSVEDDFYYLPPSLGSNSQVLSSRHCIPGQFALIKIRQKPVDAVACQVQAAEEAAVSEKINAEVKAVDTSNQIYAGRSELNTDSSGIPVSTKHPGNKNEPAHAIAEQHSAIAEDSESTPVMVPVLVSGYFYQSSRPGFMHAMIEINTVGDRSFKEQVYTDSLSGKFSFRVRGPGKYLLTVKINDEPAMNENLVIQDGVKEKSCQLIVANVSSGKKLLIIPDEQSSQEQNLDSKITYKVQVGAYKLSSVSEITRKLKERGIERVEVTKRNDLNIFLTGSEHTLGAALKLRHEIIRKGIHDAFVTAFRQGVFIPLDETLAALH